MPWSTGLGFFMSAHVSQTTNKRNCMQRDFKQIGLRLSRYEATILERLAAIMGLSMAECLRDLTKQEAVRRSIKA